MTRCIHGCIPSVTYTHTGVEVTYCKVKVTVRVGKARTF